MISCHCIGNDHHPQTPTVILVFFSGDSILFSIIHYGTGWPGSQLTKRHHPEISGNPIECCLNWLKICMIDIFRILVWFRVNPMRSICPKNHHIWGIKSDEKSHTFGLPGHAGACCRGLDLNLLLSPGLPLPWSCPSLP